MTLFRPSAAGVLLFSLAAHAATPATKPADALGVKLGKVHASGMPLSDLIDTLRDASQQNIFVNWRALGVAGVTRELPVTIDLSGLTLDAALTRLLKDVGGRRVALGHQLDEGVITISTADDLAINVETRTYDVRKLLSDEGGRAARLAEILKRVKGIQPFSWKDNGGSIGNVQELGGQLIVTHTPDVQKRIAEELNLPYVAATPAVTPATRPADAPARAAAHAAFAKTVPEVRFEKIRLADALDFVRDTSQVPVEPQWEELAKAGVTRDSVVTVRFRNVKLWKVVTATLEAVVQQNQTHNELTCSLLDDGHLLVTSRSDLMTRYMTDTRYPVDGLFRKDAKPAEKKDTKAQLYDLVTETISPESWSTVAGESGGRITWDGDTLVVHQTADAHAQIANLLAQMRDQRK